MAVLISTPEIKLTTLPKILYLVIGLFAIPVIDVAMPLYILMPIRSPVTSATLLPMKLAPVYAHDAINVVPLYMTGCI